MRVSLFLGSVAGEIREDSRFIGLGRVKSYEDIIHSTLPLCNDLRLPIK